MSSIEYKKEYAKEVREWRKSKGLCTRCGKEKAEVGYTTCLVCRLDHREYAKEHYRNNPVSEEKRLTRNEKQKKKCAEKRAAGICLSCNRPVYAGHSRCYEHYIRIGRMQREHQRKKFAYHPSGTCRICGKEPAPGHKLCPEHYKEYSERMIRYNNERAKNKEAERRRNAQRM